jgi:CheY-like chemotaxis protein
MVAETAEDARTTLAVADGLVVDAQFYGLGPEDVLDAMERRPASASLPVVVYATDGATAAWRGAQAGFACFHAHSLDMLLAHTALCLHRPPAEMSAAELAAVDAVHGVRGALTGKKALIVDDDMRNIFALATVLADEGMVTVSAQDGREAIRIVESDPTVSIVLMDIMMPDMDGIETMKAIRRLPHGHELPMIAVTAKAMKGDRQKCIEAGAWDYIAKPVDPTHLVGVLRSWLCQ